MNDFGQFVSSAGSGIQESHGLKLHW